MEKKGLAEEPFTWLFVDNVQMLCEKRHAAKQARVETWLDLAQVVRELGIEKTAKRKVALNQASYVV